MVCEARHKVHITTFEGVVSFKEPRFTPAHERRGKPIADHYTCKIAVLLKGKRNMVNLSAWGRYARGLHVGEFAGRRLDIDTTVSTFRGIVYRPTTDDSVPKPLRDDDGKVIYSTSVSFTVCDIRVKRKKEDEDYD